MYYRRRVYASTTGGGGTSVDVEIAAVVDDAAPDPLQNVTFTITVTNNGPSATTAGHVDVTWPSGLTYVSDTPSQGSYDDATGIWTVGALADEAVATLEIVGTITSIDPQTVAVALDGVEPPDIQVGNDTASVIVDADLTWVFGPFTFSSGDINATASTGSVSVGAETGTYANTLVEDSTYWQITEVNGATPAFVVTFDFTNPQTGEDAGRFFGLMKYQGNIGHTVNFKAYNWSTETYDILGQLTHDTVFSLYEFDLTTNHTSDEGLVRCQIEHTSPGNQTHNLYIDYMYIVSATYNEAGATGSYNVTLSSGATITLDENGATMIGSGSDYLDCELKSAATYDYAAGLTTLLKLKENSAGAYLSYHGSSGAGPVWNLPGANTSKIPNYTPDFTGLLVDNENTLIWIISIGKFNALVYVQNEGDSEPRLVYSGEKGTVEQWTADYFRHHLYSSTAGGLTVGRTGLLTLTANGVSEAGHGAGAFTSYDATPIVNDTGAHTPANAGGFVYELDIDNIGSAGETQIRVCINGDNDYYLLRVLPTSLFTCHRYVAGGFDSSAGSSSGAFSGGEILYVVGGASGSYKFYSNAKLLLTLSSETLANDGNAWKISNIATGAAISDARARTGIAGLATDTILGPCLDGNEFTHEADCVLSFIYRTTASGTTAHIVKVRYEDEDNYVYLHLQGDGDIFLYEKVEGVLSAALISGSGLATGNRIVAMFIGTNAYLYKADALIGTYSSLSLTSGVAGDIEKPNTDMHIANLVTLPAVAHTSNNLSAILQLMNS